MQNPDHCSTSTTAQSATIHRLAPDTTQRFTPLTQNSRWRSRRWLILRRRSLCPKRLIRIDLRPSRRRALILRQPRRVVDRRRGHVLHVVPVVGMVRTLLRPGIGLRPVATRNKALSWLLEDMKQRRGGWEAYAVVS
jgi:hypothetical protein